MAIQILKHPLFLHAQDITEITKPLHALDITYFSHVRVDNNGSMTGIGNNLGFAKSYLENKYYNADIQMARNLLLPEFVLWDAFKQTGNTRKMHKTAWDFGVRHTFTIIEQNAHSKDYYHFATHVKDAWINQVYLSNLDLLKRFIAYYKDQMNKSKDLLAVHNFKFKACENASGYSLKNASSFEILKKKRDGLIEQFFNPLAAKGKSIFQHKDTGQPIALTTQLTICLHLVFQGYTSKEIAKRMGISHRTVDHHLEKIRNLLGCRNMKELIAFYSDQIVV